MSARGTEARGRMLAPGRASGPALVLTDRLSLWGGVDAASGRIIEERHPQAGAVIARRLVVMPGGRGSSSSASVLAEMARLGTAPAAILLAEPDLILAVGAAVAAELYGTAIPVVEVPAGGLVELHDGEQLMVEPDGTVKTAGEDIRTLPRGETDPTL